MAEQALADASAFIDGYLAARLQHHRLPSSPHC
ncbi:hypothetical protein AB2F98_01590 [Escherichia coli]